MELQKRGINAAKKYLYRKGYEIIQDEFEFVTQTIDLICYEPKEDTLVFVEVYVHDKMDGSPTTHHQTDDTRQAWESAVLSWVSIHDEYTDIKVRRDTIDMWPVSEDIDRALLRHAINAN